MLAPPCSSTACSSPLSCPPARSGSSTACSSPLRAGASCLLLPQSATLTLVPPLPSLYSQCAVPSLVPRLADYRGPARLVAGCGLAHPVPMSVDRMLFAEDHAARSCSSPPCSSPSTSPRPTPVSRPLRSHLGGRVVPGLSAPLLVDNGKPGRVCRHYPQWTTIYRWTNNHPMVTRPCLTQSRVVLDRQRLSLFSIPDSYIYLEMDLANHLFDLTEPMFLTRYILSLSLSVGRLLFNE